MSKYDKPWIHRYKRGWACESYIQGHRVLGYGNSIIGAYNAYVTDTLRVNYAIKKGRKP